MGAVQAQAASVLPNALSAGYTPFPHTYIEVLPGKVSGLVQFVCIGYIIRKTFGLARQRNTPPPEWTEPITARKFAFIARGSDERTVEIALLDAVQRRLIARRPGPDRRGYVYQALVEEWPSAPAYSPKVAPKKPVQSSDATRDHEEESGASVSSQGEQAAFTAAGKLRIVPSAEPLVVLPGQASRPMPLSEAVSSIVVRNASAAEFTIPVPVISDGELHLTVEAKYPSSTSGIASPHSGKIEGEKSPNTRTRDRVLSPLLTHYQQDPRYAQLQEKLEPWFDSVYGKCIDEPFLCRILDRLGNAPVDRYIQLCSTEWEKRAQRRRPDSGIFLNWADDAKAAEDKRLVRGQREQKALAEQQREDRITALAACLREQQDLSSEIVSQDWRDFVDRAIREADPNELTEARRLLEAQGSESKRE